jgi:CRISPR-associated endoribonuclease Cas6
VLTLPAFEEKILIRMLAPLTIYSTFEDGNGNKKTHYYAPGEINFSELLEKNAIKKFSTIQADLNYDNLQLSVKPIKVSPERNLQVVRFKNTTIQGWTGIYELFGSRELITVTYEAGLGGKNPEGFGMWELYNGQQV